MEGFESSSNFKDRGHRKRRVISGIAGILTIFFVLFVLASSDPTESDYVTYLKSQVIQESNGNPIAIGLTQLLGNSLIENCTAKGDYIIFSTYKTTIDKDHSILYLGILKNFFLISSKSTNSSDVSSENVTDSSPTSGGKSSVTDQIARDELKQINLQIQNTKDAISKAASSIIEEGQLVCSADDDLIAVKENIADGKSANEFTQRVQDDNRKIQTAKDTIKKLQAQRSQLQIDLSNLTTKQQTLEDRLSGCK